MALINEFHSRQLVTTSATSTASGYFTSSNYGYPITAFDVLNNGYIQSVPENRPAKKKTFEDKLQDEIDEWLSIFKES